MNIAFSCSFFSFFCAPVVTTAPVSLKILTSRQAPFVFTPLLTLRYARFVKLSSRQPFNCRVFNPRVFRL